jgi:hypothetical protein
MHLQEKVEKELFPFPELGMLKRKHRQIEAIFKKSIDLDVFMLKQCMILHYRQCNNSGQVSCK